jgi:sulfoxide reductase heme-binding subunit YedZ
VISWLQPAIAVNTVSRIPTSYWATRAKRHLVLGIAALAMAWVTYLAVPGNDFRHRVSMGTAYSALALLALCLCLGPWKALRRKPNPVSFDLRRDVGIWAGILALVHTGVGLTVHLRGRMWMYFFSDLHPLKIQNTKFGLANYVGLVAALLFLTLLAISNDLALRKLKSRKWKWLQRWTYAAAILTVLHGVLFQSVENRTLPWLVAFWLVILIAFGFQAAGFFVVRRKRA